jgi:Ca-activated chloride channel family protein
MSLVDPLWLLALVLIPLVLVLAWAARSRARRYAVRFPAVASLAAAAAGAGVAWRRYVPLVALLAALAAFVLALARPQMSHRVARGDASFMLVLDHSGSMAATDVRPSRIAAAISAGNSFIDQLPSNDKVGLVGFGYSVDTAQQPTTDHNVTRRLLDEQVANGATDTGPALEQALTLLNGASKKHAPAAIVLLSDGAANEGISPVAVARTAKSEKIPIYTVALGTSGGVLYTNPFGATQAVPPDPQLMRQIAVSSGGKAFDAKTADELSSIYKSLGSKLGSVERERDLTVWALVLAGLLVLLALGSSVRTVSRVA